MVEKTHKNTHTELKTKLDFYPAKVYPPFYSEGTPPCANDTSQYVDPSSSPIVQNTISKNFVGGGGELKTPFR